MKWRTFIELLFLVAVVAIIYSPSTIGLGSNIDPLTSSTGGLSHFITYLGDAGFHVEIANSSSQELSFLGNASAFVLIGADQQLTPAEQQAIYSRYQNGSMSILMAEGNTTNSQFIQTYFGGSVSGAVITDPTSAFANEKQFYVTLRLGGTSTQTFLDVASPLTIEGNILTPAAVTSDESTVAGDSTPGSQVVAAVAQSPAGGRAFFITSAAPFTNSLMLPSQGTTSRPPNDTAAVESMVAWAFQSGAGRTLVLDNAHYKPTMQLPSVGISVGYVALLLFQGLVSDFASPFGLAGSLFSGGSSFLGIPAFVFSLVFAVIALAFVRRILKRYFANEKVVKDDQPVPLVERQVMAESEQRVDFVSMTRNKSFYVATCVQLYEVMDEVSMMEFAQGVATLTPDKLAPKIGELAADRAQKFIAELSKIYNYSTGKKRFLFPPVLSWKRKVASLTSEAESLLNALGMSMKGEGESKQLEYALRH